MSWNRPNMRNKLYYYDPAENVDIVDSKLFQDI